MKILVLSGSGREGSLNVRLTIAAEAILRDLGHDVTRKTIRDYPCALYDGDLESSDGIPAAAAQLGTAMTEHDAVIISTPEYNGSVPGPLKNLVDWLSRLSPKPFTNVDGLIMSASPGMRGGHDGARHLRVPLERLGMHLWGPMFSLAQARDRLAEDGSFTHDGSEKILRTMLSDFCERLAKITG